MFFGDLLRENPPEDVDGLKNLRMRDAVVDRGALLPPLEDPVVPKVLEMQR